jgi:hypothetical protein
VKPSAVKARPTPRAKVAPTREINPGDLICGGCGEGNDPSRRFCRRCGASLQQAAVFALPWYKRWWRRLTQRKTRQAGDRPRVRRRAFGGSGPGWLTSSVTKVILAAVAVIVVLSLVGPWHDSIHHRINRYYHNVLNVVHPTYNPIHPNGAIATSSAPGHPAALAIDGASNTSWWTGGRGTGVGQSLTLGLESPTNVDKIGFLIGDQDSQGNFLKEGRPSEVLLRFLGAHPYSKKLTFNDSPSFQSYTLGAKDATRLIITIETVIPAQRGSHAAIAEVELFKKS